MACVCLSLMFLARDTRHGDTMLRSRHRTYLPYTHYNGHNLLYYKTPRE